MEEVTYRLSYSSRNSDDPNFAQLRTLAMREPRHPSDEVLEKRDQYIDHCDWCKSVKCSAKSSRGMLIRLVAQELHKWRNGIR
jgi:hypothetical protein